MVMTAFATTATAQTTAFRVETDVFVGEEPKPVQQTLTLFSSGVAYDFSMDEPNRVVMIDPLRNRIVLLDAEKKLQTQIELTQLTALMDSARNQAIATELAVYVRDAEQVEKSGDGKTITVGKKILKYVSTLQDSKEPEFAKQYAEFADTSAMLNAWQARNPPPFARLSLNREIANLEKLPEEISRITFLPDSGKEVPEHQVRCKLHCNWRLSKDDERQLAEVGKMLVNFTTVSAQEFFSVASPVAAKQDESSTR